MRFHFFLMTILIVTSGCSELKVIGRAAVRELRADAIPVGPPLRKERSGAAAEQEEDRLKIATVEPTFSAYRIPAENRGAPPRPGKWEE